MSNSQIANPTSVTVHLPRTKEVKPRMEEMYFSSGGKEKAQAVKSAISTLEVRWAYPAR